VSQTGNGVVDKTKDLCVGCHNDFYNGKNDKGIGECWLYEQARLAKRFKIGWWTDPMTSGAFEEVWTLNCHIAPGKYALQETLPAGAPDAIKFGTRPPRIRTMGQGEAEKHAPALPTICISIRSPGSPIPALNPELVAVLWLEFEDDCWDDWETRDKGMTPAQGVQVAEFIRRHEGRFREILIHCFVGASRSVSMAIALDMEDVGEYEAAPGRIPNRNVYLTTRQAFQKAPVPAEATS
jgi:predicted protein tyrosine phosphatase